MSLDKDAVRKIAYLARINVPDEDLDGLAGELSNILGWVEQLGEVDTDGIEPMSSVANLAQPQRQDIVTGGNIRDKVLANAPEPGNGCFLVPKVVE